MLGDYDPRERALTLIGHHRERLTVLEEGIRDGDRLSAEEVALVESMLLEATLAGRKLKLKNIQLTGPSGYKPETVIVAPDDAQLTGPSGYDPKPVFVKCDKCDHYRFR